jgi:hypothetical protein
LEARTKPFNGAHVEEQMELRVKGHAIPHIVQKFENNTGEKMGKNEKKHNVKIEVAEVSKPR